MLKIRELNFYRPTPNADNYESRVTLHLDVVFRCDIKKTGKLPDGDPLYKTVVYLENSMEGTGDVKKILSPKNDDTIYVDYEEAKEACQKIFKKFMGNGLEDVD